MSDGESVLDALRRRLTQRRQGKPEPEAPARPAVVSRAAKPYNASYGDVASNCPPGMHECGARKEDGTYCGACVPDAYTHCVHCTWRLDPEHLSRAGFRPCAGTNRDGTPCKRLVRRGALCWQHRPSEDITASRLRRGWRRCEGTTAKGERCHRWAFAGRDDVALCWQHKAVAEDAA